MADPVVKAILRLEDEFSRRFDDFERKAEESAGGASKAFAAVGIGIGGIGVGVIAFGKIVTGTFSAVESVVTGVLSGIQSGARFLFGLGERLVAEFSGVSSELDEIAKTAVRVQAPAQELTELRLAAELTGTSLTGLSTGLRVGAKNLDDFRRGTGEAQDAFAALGITQDDAINRIGSGVQLLEVVAGRLAGITDEAQRVAIAQRIFGRSGTELLPILEAGAEGLAAMRGEARALGGSFSRIELGGVEAANDAVSRLGFAFTAIKERVLVEAAPAIESFVSRVEEGAKSLVPTIRGIAESIGRNLGIAAAFLPEAFREAGRFIVRDWDTVLGLLKQAGLQGVSALGATIIDGVGTAFKIGARVVLAVWDNLWGQQLLSVARGGINEIIDGLGGIAIGASRILSVVEGTFAFLWENVKQGAIRAINFVIRQFNELIAAAASVDNALGGFLGVDSLKIGEIDTGDFKTLSDLVADIDKRSASATKNILDGIDGIKLPDFEPQTLAYSIELALKQSGPDVEAFFERVASRFGTTTERFLNFAQQQPGLEGLVAKLRERLELAKQTADEEERVRRAREGGAESAAGSVGGVGAQPAARGPLIQPPDTQSPVESLVERVRLLRTSIRLGEREAEIQRIIAEQLREKKTITEEDVARIRENVTQEERLLQAGAVVQDIGDGFAGSTVQFIRDIAAGSEDALENLALGLAGSLGDAFAQSLQEQLSGGIQDLIGPSVASFFGASTTEAPGPSDALEEAAGLLSGSAAALNNAGSNALTGAASGLVSSGGVLQQAGSISLTGSAASLTGSATALTTSAGALSAAAASIAGSDGLGGVADILKAAVGGAAGASGGGGGGAGGGSGAARGAVVSGGVFSAFERGAGFSGGRVVSSLSGLATGGLLLKPTPFFQSDGTPSIAGEAGREGIFPEFGGGGDFSIGGRLPDGSEVPVEATRLSGGRLGVDLSAVVESLGLGSRPIGTDGATEAFQFGGVFGARGAGGSIGPSSPDRLADAFDALRRSISVEVETTVESLERAAGSLDVRREARTEGDFAASPEPARFEVPVIGPAPFPREGRGGTATAPAPPKVEISFAPVVQVQANSAAEGEAAAAPVQQAIRDMLPEIEARILEKVFAQSPEIMLTGMSSHSQVRDAIVGLGRQGG